MARGLAAHLGVSVTAVRLTLIGLAFAQGVGVLAYAAFWVVVPLAPELPVGPAARSSRRLSWGHRGREWVPLLSLAVLVLGGLVFMRAYLQGFRTSITWPLAAVGLGVAIIWRQADDTQRARWWAVGGQQRGWGLARTLAGVVLVAAGGGVFLAARGELRQARDGLLGTAVIVTGLVLIFGPYWVRMASELTEERRERIRSQERAEVAAHVHDSVLHTLTLIQRHVEDPREVVRLARAQERELRTWLYRPARDGSQTLAGAVPQLAAEVEEAHGVPIEVVCVGDCPLDDRLDATLQAAREAMVNAAKYAGVAVISVYAEVEPGQVTVFVRDRGAGFDADAVPPDRLGVRESIVGRMQRHGGHATVRSAPGEGTEVRLELPRSAT